MPESVYLANQRQQTLMKVCMQAEDKAENATARLEELLHRTRKNWLPLWLEEHYQKVPQYIFS